MIWVSIENQASTWWEDGRKYSRHHCLPSLSFIFCFLGFLRRWSFRDDVWWILKQVSASWDGRMNDKFSYIFCSRMLIVWAWRWGRRWRSGYALVDVAFFSVRVISSFVVASSHVCVSFFSFVATNFVFVGSQIPMVRTFFFLNRRNCSKSYHLISPLWHSYKYLILNETFIDLSSTSLIVFKIDKFILFYFSGFLDTSSIMFNKFEWSEN